jgi:hypothetical protein
MKLLAFLFLFGMSLSTFAAPTKTDDEISLDEINAELMNEMETVEISDEDAAFLDEEIELPGTEEKVEMISKTNKPTEQNKKTVKSATTPTIKK